MKSCLALLATVGLTASALAQTMNISANDPRITYSDYVRLTFGDSVTQPGTKLAQFDRLIDHPSPPGQPTGYRYDNPGARVRFRTNATTVTARFYYNDKHVRFQALNGNGVYFIDGVTQDSWTFNVANPATRPSPEAVNKLIFTQATAAMHDFELVLPYGDSVDFQGVTVNTGAIFEAVVPRPAVRYVAYGDSVTHGYTASRVTRGYSFQVAQAMNWQLLNMGFGGRASTAADGTVLGSLGANVITVLMGVNDWQGNVPIATYRTRMQEFIQNLRAVQPRVPVYLITMLWVNPTWAPANGITGDLEEYRQVLRDIVAQSADSNLHIVEGPSLIDNEPQFFDPVAVHPNDAGFAQMASRLAAAGLVAESPGAAAAATVGYWRFENAPGFYKDSAGQQNDLTPAALAGGGPSQATLPASGAGSRFHDPIPLNDAPNAKAANFVVASQDRFALADNPNLALTNITVEAYINLTTGGQQSTFRAIASHGGNLATNMGWQLVVTGEGSGLGPRNLAFQHTSNGVTPADLDTIDSNFQITPGVDYYVAFTMNAADTSSAGATFYLQDLTNGGPLQSVQKPHVKTSIFHSSADFNIGGSGPGAANTWDGLMDEVRLSNLRLGPGELLAARRGEIAIESAGADLIDGSTSVAFGGALAAGGSSTRTFTIRNSGEGYLTGLSVTIDGANASSFSVDVPPPATVGPGSSATFSISFGPATAGLKTAALHLASNDADENPFDIELTGRGLAPDADDDGDGLSNAVEVNLAGSGFDPLSDSSPLLALLRDNGLYQASDMQTLAFGSPLLERNPTTGHFHLSIAVLHSPDLATWSPLISFAPTYDVETGIIDMEITPGDASVQFFRVLGAKP